mmetsp:Transcript_17026/g.35744  ORF Transcript_17026/g.35744 Transcript_17026/m.35744 type:complete len:170 (-) Transcript_17026:239-748(-)
MMSPIPNVRTASDIAVTANAKKRVAINVLRAPPDFVLHMEAGADAPFRAVIKEHETNSSAQHTEAESDANTTDAISRPSVDRVIAPVTAEGVGAMWKDAINRLSPRPVFVSSMEEAKNAITRVAKRLLVEELFIALLMAVAFAANLKVATGLRSEKRSFAALMAAVPEA